MPNPTHPPGSRALNPAPCIPNPLGHDVLCLQVCFLTADLLELKSTQDPSKQLQPLNAITCSSLHTCPDFAILKALPPCLPRPTPHICQRAHNPKLCISNCPCVVLTGALLDSRPVRAQVNSGLSASSSTAAAAAPHTTAGRAAAAAPHTTTAAATATAATEFRTWGTPQQRKPPETRVCCYRHQQQQQQWQQCQASASAAAAAAAAC